jgi:EpsD family peptidyl-prolyl cis-trans isomerase
MKPSTTCLSLTLFATAFVLGLTACGNQSNSPVATQVAARVGSEEVTVHQINQVLSRNPSAASTPEGTQALSRDVLEKLIDQQLAVDQAHETKLDRSPEVVSQLEFARRDILARAYLQKITFALPKIAPEEIKKYYTDHPQLFSERRIFNVQEIVVPATPPVVGLTEQLRSFAAAGKSIEDIAAWLKAGNIKFGGGSAVRAAEQIPLELLPQVHTLKDGQSIVFTTGQTNTLLRVALSQLAPVDEVTALPRIEQFLSNQRASAAAVSNIKQLRANTKITYMGEFAGTAPATPASAPTAPAASTADTTQTTLEKGVAGLK